MLKIPRDVGTFTPRRNQENAWSTSYRANPRSYWMAR